MKPRPHTGLPKPRRSYFSLVTVNSTSALLFGGTTMQAVILNDLWLFCLVRKDWTELKLHDSVTPVPSPRYAHAAAVVQSEMFVFGGRNQSGICYEEMWKFNLTCRKWTVVKSNNRGPRLASIQPCIVHATAQAGHLWIAVGCDRSHFSPTCASSDIQLWMFIVHLKMWELLTVYRPETETSIASKPVQPIMFWRGYLMRIETVRMTMHYMTLGCPRGLTSRNISEVACDICKVGSYSDTASEKCLRCPSGTTTTIERSTSISDCNVCIRGYCQNGQCLVVTDSSTQVPVCHCQVGFTGSHCQYATYYYVGLGVLLFLVAVSLATAIIWYIRRNRRVRETALRQQIEQLNEVWQISWEEVTMLEEIGGGASGRVWLARYRDITVAVKLLTDPQMSLEFAREIKFMQTIRHPNVVLFLGAGKTSSSPQGQPFLVIEFTRHGSLRQVLDDDSVELTTRRKIRSALDASKGMSFLHNLDPPRIHRDLKCDNLLVSESWIVKVADFGLGRPYDSGSKSRSVRQRNRLGFRERTITEPLLEMREDLSVDGIGTAKWSAPELFLKQTYDHSIDVYSFGVVLWEIWTRDRPFRQYPIHTDEFFDAVVRGERPPVPDDCLSSYANLMQACWSGYARARPSFNDVVRDLENMDEFTA